MKLLIILFTLLLGTAALKAQTIVPFSPGSIVLTNADTAIFTLSLKSIAPVSTFQVSFKNNSGKTHGHVYLQGSVFGTDSTYVTIGADSATYSGTSSSAWSVNPSSYPYYRLWVRSDSTQSTTVSAKAFYYRD